MIRHDIIVRRFREGMGLSQLCSKYNLAEWEVEDALRDALITQAQKVIPSQPEEIPTDEPEASQENDSQLTIAEVYGVINL